MLEFSGYIRTTSTLRKDPAVDPQYVHGVADSIAEIRLIGQRRRKSFPELNMVRKHCAVSKCESESATGFINGAKDGAHVLTQECHLGEIPLQINCQFNIPLAGVGQRDIERPAKPAALHESTRNDFIESARGCTLGARRPDGQHQRREDCKPNDSVLPQNGHSKSRSHGTLRRGGSTAVIIPKESHLMSNPF